MSRIRRSTVANDQILQDLEDENEEAESLETVEAGPSCPLVPNTPVSESNRIAWVLVKRNGKLIGKVQPAEDESAIQEWFGGGNYNFIAINSSGQRMKFSDPVQIIGKPLTDDQIADRYAKYKETMGVGIAFNDQKTNQEIHPNRLEVSADDIYERTQQRQEQREENQRKRRLDDEEARERREEQRHKRELDKLKAENLLILDRHKLDMETLGLKHKNDLETLETNNRSQRERDRENNIFQVKLMQENFNQMLSVIKDANGTKKSLKEEISEVMSVAKTLGIVDGGKKDDGPGLLETLKEAGPLVMAGMETLKTVLQAKAQVEVARATTPLPTQRVEAVSIPELEALPAILENENNFTLEQKITVILKQMGADNAFVENHLKGKSQEELATLLKEMEFGINISNLIKQVKPKFDKKITPEVLADWIVINSTTGDISTDLVDSLLSLGNNGVKSLLTQAQENEAFIDWFSSSIDHIRVNSEVPKPDEPAT